MVSESKSPYISLYRDVRDTVGTEITLQDFFDGIAIGKWKKQVEAVRALGDNESAQKELKLKQENAIIGGTSNAATNNTMREMSGYMAIDIDELGDDVETVRLEINNDQYTFASFASIRGKGLCVVIRIQPERWDEAWEGAKLYYLQKFGRVVDKNTGNMARRRFVSYDPGIYVNNKSTLFKLYPKKARVQPKPAGVYVHTNNDVEYILEQIERRGLDLTSSYEDWFKLGFALISEYGEGARNYFHRLSQFHPQYTPDRCDRTFSYLIRYGARQITIKTFYWHAKQNGLDTMTPLTKEIVRGATMQKRIKIKQEDVIDSFVRVGGCDAEMTASIVSQVFASKEEVETDDTLFDQLELFLNTNYNLRRNEITRYIEDGDVPLKDEDINSIYIAAAKVFDMKVSKPMVESVIHSNFVRTYHPVRAFFEKYQYRKPHGIIDQLASTIKHDMSKTNSNYAHFFIRKWLIGFVSSAYGEQSPLVIVLTGEGNTGKTQWFRRLLPDDLMNPVRYYAETKFDQGKDDEILMCKKLLLMNDEFGGNTVKESKKFKDLTDKAVFTVRRPYGSAHEDLPRLAVLAGTSNDPHILNDPTTKNRRIIPINVISIDHDAYNKIDKIDLLMEAYHAYKDGETTGLTNEHIDWLTSHTGRFQDVSLERDMADKYFKVPEDRNSDSAELKSQGEILEYLAQVSGIKTLKPKTLSQELKALGFQYADGEYYKPEGKTKRGFWLVKRTIGGASL